MNRTVATMLEQIGRRNLAAISGLRVGVYDDTTVSLPVGSGYSVEVEYVPGVDLYDVRRVFRRGLRSWVKDQWHGVYAEQLGEVAYRASCFENAG